MKPLFTIHAGELLVGEFIERNFRSLNVWVPAKDTGLDLLVTDSDNQKAVSLQVKFSRDFLATHMKATLQLSLRACGWWRFSRKQITQSKADYWVLVLLGFAHRSTDYIILLPAELLRRLDTIHRGKEAIQSYFWVTKNKRCWETRGLKPAEQVEVSNDQYLNDIRDFSRFLNCWDPIERISS